MVGIRISVSRTKWEEGRKRFRWGSWEIVDVSINLLRCALLLLLIGLYLGLIVLPKAESERAESSEETTGLLNDARTNGQGYGAIAAAGDAKNGKSSENGDGPGWARKTAVGKQSWWEYLRGYTVFFPYLWPSKERKLQGLMLLCFGLVVLQRGVNVMVPHQLGIVTDILSGEDGPRKSRPDN